MLWFIYLNTTSFSNGSNGRAGHLVNYSTAWSCTEVNGRIHITTMWSRLALSFHLRAWFCIANSCKTPTAQLIFKNHFVLKATLFVSFLLYRICHSAVWLGSQMSEHCSVSCWSFLASFCYINIHCYSSIAERIKKRY